MKKLDILMVCAIMIFMFGLGYNTGKKVALIEIKHSIESIFNPIIPKPNTTRA